MLDGRYAHQKMEEKLEDKTMKIEMRCPTCGSTKFSYDECDPNSAVQCLSCKRIMSREELLQYNGNEIHDAIEVIKKDVMSDVRKEFKKIFKGK